MKHTDPGIDKETGINYPKGYYTNPEADSYRMGAFYIVSGNNRFGAISEYIRHYIQNIGIHDKFLGLFNSSISGFRVLNKDGNIYYNQMTRKKYSLW